MAPVSRGPRLALLASVAMTFLTAPSTRSAEPHGSPVHFLPEKANTGVPPLSRIRVFDPYEQRPVEFEGYSLTEALDRAYGRSWRDLLATHQLRMKCRDGYRLSVPLSRVLKHHAVIAVRRIDQASFTLLRKDLTPERTVELAPAYLVWENERDLSIRSEGDYGWPFQWEEAILERLGEGDPLPLPRKGSSMAASRGYSHFKVHCLKCHSLEGIGGKVGPELHHPVNVTRYWRSGFLERWILHPASIRKPNGMPPLAISHPDRKAIANDIVAYLSSIPPSKENP
ncbi:hypothetical protein EB061_02955 [bacterium]|jgi:hypothetical protein|nr:hypothetical protein [bacterium]